MLKYPQYPEGVWVRVCQECGHAQKSSAPRDTVAWKNAKCKSCQSTALDYGHVNSEVVDDILDE